jgi:hypothetical protein
MNVSESRQTKCGAGISLRSVSPTNWQNDWTYTQLMCAPPDLRLKLPGHGASGTGDSCLGPQLKPRLVSQTTVMQSEIGADP